MTISPKDVLDHVLSRFRFIVVGAQDYRWPAASGWSRGPLLEIIPLAADAPVPDGAIDLFPGLKIPYLLPHIYITILETSDENQNGLSRCLR